MVGLVSVHAPESHTYAYARTDAPDGGGGLADATCWTRGALSTVAEHFCEFTGS